MKASKFSDAQKSFIFKQGDDGVSVAAICRKAGIGNFTNLSAMPLTRLSFRES
ncbi:hypothetical protein G6L74_25225 [Agrobacterium tumefaciens]|nr:hypothetical protein [Agrobacterium tumefaciens]NSZ77049.1 hypothetical protein [Agrobacterium tumefaciens]